MEALEEWDGCGQFGRMWTIWDNFGQLDRM